MSDLGDPSIMPMKPKYQRAIVALELGVSETWRVTHKQQLIEALEKIMGVPYPGVGPGGAVMNGIFIRVEDPAIMDPILEQYRLEFPLVERVSIMGPDGIVRRVEVDGPAHIPHEQQLPLNLPLPHEVPANWRERTVANAEWAAERNRAREAEQPHKHHCQAPHGLDEPCRCECGLTKEAKEAWPEPGPITVRPVHRYVSAHPGDDVRPYPKESLEFNDGQE